MIPAMRPRPWAPVLAVVAATLSVAAPAAAQGKRCDEKAGTLSIQGMRCEGCSFRMGRSGIDEARFRTEPEVIAVARGFTRGDRLRPGDRIVAIDGALITTRAGSQKLVDIRASQPVTVRVRRGGEPVDLRIVAGSACALRRSADRGELELERLDDAEAGMAPLPPMPPAAEGAELPPLPPLPPASAAPPAPPAAPSGYLGFGFSCSRCGWRDGVMFFTAPPVVEGVAEGSPAQRAGLQTGDEVLKVDGLDLTTPAGGERFGALEPGQRVRLTVQRDGATRSIALVAAERPPRGRAATPGAPSARAATPATPAAPAPPAAPGARAAAGAPGADRLRFEGRLGETRIEVRGAPVRVTRDDATGELVIRTSDTVIVLRSGG